MARMRHLYGRSVRLLDDWLARVLDAMDSAGVLADTLVVVTSDHGENLGEHNRLGHAFSLDNRLIHVPLVASGPAPLAAPGAWSLADFPRLLADTLGLEGHPWADDGAGAPAGVAVAQLDALAEPNHPRLLRAVEEWHLDDDAVRRMTSSATCATDGHFKLVRHDDGEQLYDLDTDPLEARPLPSAQLDGVVPVLRKAIDEAHGGPPTTTRDAGAAVAAAEVADLEDRMRLLGYL